MKEQNSCVRMMNNFCAYHATQARSYGGTADPVLEALHENLIYVSLLASAAPAALRVP